MTRALIPILLFASFVLAQLCPDGSAPFNCFVNPCQLPCPAATSDAVCTANYCGGCFAEWVDSSGVAIDCQDTGVVAPDDSQSPAAAPVVVPDDSQPCPSLRLEAHEVSDSKCLSLEAWRPAATARCSRKLGHIKRFTPLDQCSDGSFAVVEITCCPEEFEEPQQPVPDVSPKRGCEQHYEKGIGCASSPRVMAAAVCANSGLTLAAISPSGACTEGGTIDLKWECCPGSEEVSKVSHCKWFHKPSDQCVQAERWKSLAVSNCSDSDLELADIRYGDACDHGGHKGARWQCCGERVRPHVEEASDKCAWFGKRVEACAPAERLKLVAATNCSASDQELADLALGDQCVGGGHNSVRWQCCASHAQSGKNQDAAPTPLPTTSAPARAGCVWHTKSANSCGSEERWHGLAKSTCASANLLLADAVFLDACDGEREHRGIKWQCCDTIPEKKTEEFDTSTCTWASLEGQCYPQPVWKLSAMDVCKQAGKGLKAVAFGAGCSATQPLPPLASPKPIAAPLPEPVTAGPAAIAPRPVTVLPGAQAPVAKPVSALPVAQPPAPRPVAVAQPAVGPSTANPVPPVAAVSPVSRPVTVAPQPVAVNSGAAVPKPMPALTAAKPSPAATTAVAKPSMPADVQPSATQLRFQCCALKRTSAARPDQDAGTAGGAARGPGADTRVCRQWREDTGALDRDFAGTAKKNQDGDSDSSALVGTARPLGPDAALGPEGRPLPVTKPRPGPDASSDVASGALRPDTPRGPDGRPLPVTRPGPDASSDVASGALRPDTPRGPDGRPLPGPENARPVGADARPLPGGSAAVPAGQASRPAVAVGVGADGRPLPDVASGVRPDARPLPGATTTVPVGQASRPNVAVGVGADGRPLPAQEPRPDVVNGARPDARPLPGVAAPAPLGQEAGADVAVGVGADGRPLPAQEPRPDVASGVRPDARPLPVQEAGAGVAAGVRPGAPPALVPVGQDSRPDVASGFGPDGRPMATRTPLGPDPAVGPMPGKSTSFPATPGRFMCVQWDDDEEEVRFSSAQPPNQPLAGAARGPARCGSTVCENGLVCCNQEFSLCVKPGQTCRQPIAACPACGAGTYSGAQSCCDCSAGFYGRSCDKERSDIEREEAVLNSRLSFERKKQELEEREHSECPAGQNMCPSSDYVLPSKQGQCVSSLRDCVDLMGLSEATRACESKAGMVFCGVECVPASVGCGAVVPAVRACGSGVRCLSGVCAPSEQACERTARQVQCESFGEQLCADGLTCKASQQECARHLKWNGCPPGQQACEVSPMLRCAAPGQCAAMACPAGQQNCGPRHVNNSVVVRVVNGVSLPEPHCATECPGVVSHLEPAGLEVSLQADLTEELSILSTDGGHTLMKLRVARGSITHSLNPSDQVGVKVSKVADSDKLLGGFKRFLDKGVLASPLVTITMTTDVKVGAGVTAELPVNENGDLPCAQRLAKMAVFSVDDISVPDGAEKMSDCRAGATGSCSCLFDVLHFTSFAVVDEEAYVATVNTNVSDPVLLDRAVSATVAISSSQNVLPAMLVLLVLTVVAMLAV